jgi:aryl-alcohol dehydrogenase
MPTITAAVTRAASAPFSLETIELADPRHDEILVRISACGLCHTDLRVRDGAMSTRWPAVLGHEGTGVVEQVGSHVTEFRPGDHVVLSYAWCGRCAACLQGRPTRCAQMMPLNFGGTRADGTTTMTAADGTAVHGSFFGQSSFATHALVTASSAVAVPADLDPAVAAAMGCSMQTGAGAILHTLGVRAADRVIVSGAGPVGLAAVMAARAAGATRIVAVDVIKSRLDLAQEIGATHTVDGNDDNLLAKIQQAAGGAADAAFDTSGVPAVVLADLLALTADGRLGLGAGGLQDAARLPTAMLGKTIHNVIAGDSVPRVLIPRLLDLHRHGMFPVERLVTSYPLADIDTAVAHATDATATKVVLTMG